VLLTVWTDGGPRDPISGVLGILPEAAEAARIRPSAKLNELDSFGSLLYELTNPSLCRWYNAMFRLSSFMEIDRLPMLFHDG
jgi:hypothetical protein